MAAHKARQLAAEADLLCGPWAKHNAPMAGGGFSESERDRALCIQTMLLASIAVDLEQIAQTQREVMTP